MQTHFRSIINRNPKVKPTSFSLGWNFVVKVYSTAQFVVLCYCLEMTLSSCSQMNVSLKSNNDVTEIVPSDIKYNWWWQAIFFLTIKDTINQKYIISNNCFFILMKQKANAYLYSAKCNEVFLKWFRLAVNAKHQKAE